MLLALVVVLLSEKEKPPQLLLRRLVAILNYSPFILSISYLSMTILFLIR
jgi:hypothetical protein